MKKARKMSVIVLIALSLILLSSVFGYVVFETRGAYLQDEKLPNAARSMVIYDKDDEIIQDTNGYVALRDISKHIQNAFIAVEDKRFYNHSGIDLQRLVGALYHNIKIQKTSQGGSTISNQLVKNTHLTNERTLRRKLREAKLTFSLERKYDKNAILEMYLNVIYFGRGIYGVNDACRMLYGKFPRDVTPLEAASLAATVANPSIYSILSNPKNNHARSLMVLRLMRSEKYLTEDDYERAVNDDIIISCDDFYNNYDKTYCNLALNEAYSILGAQNSKDTTGYKIYTYFDKKAQNTARSAISIYSGSSSEKSGLSCETVIAENDTAGISAYLSSNPSTPIKRQPGSLLKPFIYAEAIEKGLIIPETPLLDEPINFSGYAPSNFGRTYAGWISARNALARSINSVAVVLLDKIGIQNGKRMIEQTGISLSERDNDLALALGGTTYGSTVLDICNGYMTLAEDGTYRKVSFIRKITDRNGKVIYTDSRERVHTMSQDTSFLITDMLRTCTQSGTAKQLKYLPYEIAAKTGTVEKNGRNTDAWCAAYTSEHTFVCRYSADNSDSVEGLTGGNLSTKTLRAIMKELYSEDPPAPFVLPMQIKTLEIDKTIKEEFHAIVPYTKGFGGERERVYSSSKFRPDAIDPERLLIGDLSVNILNERPLVSFPGHEGVDYEVKINGNPCEKYENGYISTKQRFPIGKLEIYCRKNDRIIWKTSRLIRVN